MKEEIENSRRKDSPLRDAGANDPLGGCRREIEARGSAAADVAGKPTDQVGVEGTVTEFEKKSRMVHRVERLGVIDGNCGRAGSWFVLIESDSYGGGKRKKGSGCGVTGFETVL